MTDSVKVQRIHHVAYRCNDAKETVDFYKKVMNMELLLAIAEDEVPSTKEPDPYMHLFLDAGNGNVLAFFELPNAPEMGKDGNTPEWVQHIAFEVDSMDDLLAAKKRAQDNGLKVLGPTDHGIFQSIYFFDPNGHRLELAVNTVEDGMLDELKRVAPAMIDYWNSHKKAPKHAAWLHNGDDFKQYAAKSLEELDALND
jgi:catechol 2,3-dioxygenase-like lactoylglutathione lyase family enzyme